MKQTAEAIHKANARFKELCYPDVDCSRGAPMGRGSFGPEPEDESTIIDRALPMEDGGYDKGGAYWGTPYNVRVRFTLDGLYREYYRGPEREPRNRFMHDELRGLWAMFAGSGDPYSDCMSFWFATACLLHERFGWQSVPAHWEYRHGGSIDEDDAVYSHMLDLVESEDVTEADLVHFGNVLCRYRRLIGHLGLAY